MRRINILTDEIINVFRRNSKWKFLKSLQTHNPNL